jgi:uncharacterized protein involved in exopolysaccharide biosynthesis
MTDETANLILEHLRHLRSGQDGLREDMREVKTRLNLVEQQMATLGHMYAAVTLRLDRVEARLDRIEARLGLVDAPI